MPKVRLAGTVAGERDPNREIRARLLYSLFRQGWDIYNGNGDQRISLANIQRKIIEADAFVFTPGATLEDFFKAVSIFVGYQTCDRHLLAKPTVVLNSDRSWDGLFLLLEHLNGLGTVKQRHEEFLLAVDSPDEVIMALEAARARGLDDTARLPSEAGMVESFETPLPMDHYGNVGVFCSASIEEQAFLVEGYEFGRSLARNGMGCVSGAGKSGIMGEVVRGAVDAGGWTGGSNVPHIIALEGLPDGLSSFWLKPDIYTRMEIMLERSDAFAIFPGGSGTVQELLALLIFKRLHHPAAVAKPVVVYNRVDAEGNAFWSPLIQLLGTWCADGEFTVVSEFDTLLPTLERLLEASRTTMV